MSAARAGLLLAAAGMVWLTRIGLHSGYAAAILGPVTRAGRRGQCLSRHGDFASGGHAVSHRQWNV
jgi:hypothetical protein